MLATAVAAAVTTPVVVLSVTPAFADTRPTARTPQHPASPARQAKPSLAELERAATEAAKALDAAVAAERAAGEDAAKANALTAPHNVAVKTARQVAGAAAVAKTDADKALAAAEKALAELPVDATDEQRKDAERKVTEAGAVVTATTEAKATAEAQLTRDLAAAYEAMNAAEQRLELAKKAVVEARLAKQAADKALADAKKAADQEDEECAAAEPRLTAVVTGLPTKVVAGEPVDFSVRLTNGTGETLDKVQAFVSVKATDKTGLKDLGTSLKLQWSSTTSPKWQNLDRDDRSGAISALKAGTGADVKLRLSVDASAPAGDATAFIGGEYLNTDGSCGSSPTDKYDFTIEAAVAKPTPAASASPTPTPTATPTPSATPSATAQGGTSPTPLSTTSGTLAATGSSTATQQLALAGGAAVVLGSGAVFLARRRNAGTGTGTKGIDG
ncbi:LPXTG cell wall anchor domain-containing protein [Streptomyces sp. NPDC050856]|uniref:LPXTG cell wall anchor domain-containing protein n=1 Tax=Streptomyces sp. NPDC050856 TaxID=3154939 RepID=UPI003409C6B4